MLIQADIVVTYAICATYAMVVYVHLQNFAEDTMNELLAWYGYDKTPEQVKDMRHRKPRDSQRLQRRAGEEEDVSVRAGACKAPYIQRPCSEVLLQTNCGVQKPKTTLASN